MINTYNENDYYEEYVKKCINCDHTTSENNKETYSEMCLFCKRYILKGKIFLNNVG